MRRVGVGVVLGVCTLFALACSGVGGTGGDGAFGSVSHSTWLAKGGRYRIVFKKGSVTHTWANMNGGPVDGEFSQDGDEVHVVFTPANHFGSTEYNMSRTGKCSLALYSRKDKNGVDVEMSTVYERTVPECED